MTIDELKQFVKQTLDEAVPFDKSADIQRALKSKYGVEMQEYTFGVEFEFIPIVEELSRHHIEDLLNGLYDNSGSLPEAYTDWLDDKRKNAVNNWISRGNNDISRYDDSYGPMDLYTFDDNINEPDSKDFSDDEEFEQALAEYEEKRDDVFSEHRRWENRDMNDYIDEFVSDLARSGEWRDYVPEDEQQIVDMDGQIQEALYFITSLGEDAEEGDGADSTTWAVGEDGPNVEIRSRHMTQSENDFKKISQVGDWVSDQRTSGKTGMHIHVGLPSNFDVFDLLAMTTLVDEDAIKGVISSDRDLGQYAKLRRSISNMIVNKIRDYMKKQPDARESVPASFVLTNEQMMSILKGFDRNHGTNIAAFSEHKTIEFRYLGSDLADKAVKWIEYFLLLPRIAKSRNKITLNNIYDEKVIATRLPGKIRFSYSAYRNKRLRMPMPTEPADVIKQKASEPVSVVDKLKKSKLTEQKVDKKEYERRSKFIKNYIEQLIAKSPGTNREEKLTYVWSHHKSTMEKLMAGMNLIGKSAIFGRIGDEPVDSYKSKFNADLYYIRFGDFPKSGRSKNYATGEIETGVSAYPAKWNVEKNRWEIIETQLEEFAALYSLTDDITEGKGRPVYLVQGQELLSLGSDGEPMLDINNVKIIKKLEPSEFFSREIGEDWNI